MTKFLRKGRAEAFGILVIVCAGLLIGWQSYEHYRETRAHAVTLLQQLARTGEAEIDGSLRNVDTVLREIVREVRLTGTSQSDKLKFVRTRAQAFPEIQQIGVTDAAGVVRFATVPGLEGFDASQRLYYRAPKENREGDRLFVTGPIKGITGRTLFFVSRAVRKADGAFDGVIVATLSPAFFDGVLRSILPPGHSSDGVLTQTGEILSRQPNPEHYRALAIRAKAVFERHLAAKVPMTVQRFRSAFDGTDRIAVFRTLANFPLTVVVTMDYGDLDESVQSGLFIYAGLFLLIVIVTVSSVIADRRIRRDEAERLERVEASRNFFDRLLETANAIIVGLDDAGRVVLCNSMAEQVTGFRRGDILGRHWSDTVVPRDVYPQAWETFETHRLAEGGQDQFETPIRRHPDGERWVLWRNSRIADPDNRLVSIWFGIDVTRRRQVQKELEAANERLRQSVETLETLNHQSLLFRGMTDDLETCHTSEEAFAAAAGAIQALFPGRPGGLYAFSEARRAMELVVAWPEFVTMAPTIDSRRCSAVREKVPYRWDSNHPHAHCAHFGEAYGGSGLCAPVMAHGELLGMLVLRDEQEVPLPTACQVISREDEEGSLGLTVCEHLGLSVSTLRLRQRLVDQAMRDPLTGLYNRRIMAEMFTRELTVAKRKGRPLSVVMIDIDHFKRFNDRHGHEAGDAVLRTVAELLSRECRSSDVVCRYGGEEFAILLPEANRDSAIQRACRLGEAVKEREVVNRGVVLESVTISVGIAVYPDHGEDADALLRAADEALYQSKIQGRDRVTVADQQTRDLFTTLAWNDRVTSSSDSD